MENQIAEIHELDLLLRHMRIHPPAYNYLRRRSDLQSDPALVQAWWWCSLTEEWLKDRLGLLIYLLDQREMAPAPCLTLARIWPKVTEAQRAEIRELRWRMCSPYQMSEWFAEEIPEFTAEVFAVYLALFKVAPEELGY